MNVFHVNTPILSEYTVTIDGRTQIFTRDILTDTDRRFKLRIHPAQEVMQNAHGIHPSLKTPGKPGECVHGRPMATCPECVPGIR